jgi:hypothetical protein
MLCNVHICYFQHFSDHVLKTHLTFLFDFLTDNSTSDFPMTFLDENFNCDICMSILLKFYCIYLNFC